jgi:hypothetical protein
MGIQFDRILDSFNGPFEKLPYGVLEVSKGSIKTVGSVKGYLVDAHVNKSFSIANDLLKAGVELFRVTNPANDVDAGLGSFYVPASSKTKLIIEKLAVETGVTVITTTKSPASMQKITSARVALWDTYGGSLSSGWVRFILEQYHFQADIIYPKDIDSTDLRSKYDVIVFVTGAIPAYNPGGNASRRNTDPKPEDIPLAYRKMLGHITTDKSIPQLKKFLEAGGNIVTIGSSTNLAYHLKLPVRDALVELVNGQEMKLAKEKFYIPGSVLRVSVDSTNQAAWGMNKFADVYFDGSPVFNISTEASLNGTIKPLAWFPNNKPLRSGWAWGQAYLQDGVAAFVAKVGKGNLYAFGPEITFRAQTHGTFKLLFNTLYLNQNK